MRKITLAVVVFGIFAFSATLYAAEIKVSTTEDIIDDEADGGTCSLREAILAANKDVLYSNCTAGNGADIIELPAGTYTLALAGTDEDDSYTGDLDIKSNITIKGASEGGTIIDANKIDRVFHIISGNVTLKDLTITNGMAKDCGGGIYIGKGSSLTLNNTKVSENSTVECNGGGLYNNSGTVTIENNSAITKNVAKKTGGGICTSGGAVTISNSSINENSASKQLGLMEVGGGVVNSGGIVTINNSSVSKNQINEGSGAGIANVKSGSLTLTDSTVNGNIGTDNAVGGGIYNEKSGNVKITNTVIEKNQVLTAGGIENDGTMEIENSSIGENMAVSSGGSGGCCGGIGSSGTLKISNSAIYNNQTEQSGSGGLYISTGTAILINTTISGNVSKSFGGGIGISSGDVTLYNTTITNNESDYGGGGGIFCGDTSIVKMQNTIIAGNKKTSDGSQNDCYKNSGCTVTSNGYNLIGNKADCSLVASSGDQIGTESSPISAKLDSLANNGGPTKTHALQLNSSAVDTGNPAGCMDNSGALLTADQRGEKRDSKCDIGAFEYQHGPNIAVSSLILDFTSVKVSESLSYELTASNVGGGNLTLSSAELSDTTNFSFSAGGSNPCTGEPPTLAPGGSCTGVFTFKPASAGALSATFTIGSNDPDTPTLSIALSGVGVAKTEETTETPAQCGDGITQVGSEECDDGNVASDDGCSSACKTEKAVTTTAVCGNGTVETGEDCDDGNAVDTDACSNTCKTVVASATTGGETGGAGAGGSTSSTEETSGGGCSLIR